MMLLRVPKVSNYKYTAILPKTLFRDIGSLSWFEVHDGEPYEAQNVLAVAVDNPHPPNPKQPKSNKT